MACYYKEHLIYERYFLKAFIYKWDERVQKNKALFVDPAGTGLFYASNDSLFNKWN